MLTKKQILEIKEHLERTQNPVFFFDNDPDGLCSFLLLQRYIGRGRGVVIKSFPALDINYFRKIEELNADYIFILDKPVVSDEFFKKAEQINMPIVWIDHHEMDSIVVPDFVNYYNPCLNEQKTNEPVTVLCYQITQRKEDLWIAVIGAITDWFLPEFYPEFCKKYPDLAIESDNPFEILYTSKIGSIARMLSNGLKDTTTNVVNMLRLLVKASSPQDILEENVKTYALHKRSEQIYKKYKILLDKAKKLVSKNKKILFFKYSGDLSVSGELANELSYRFPGKIIVVAYVKGAKVNISLRGKNIKEKFLKIIEGVEGAVGGGHNDAVGGQLNPAYLDDFERKLKERFE